MAKPTILTAEPGIISAYYDWFEGAENGEVLIYHVGDLAFDRDKLNATTADGIKTAGHIDAIAKRVLKDAEDGFLSISQKKIATSVYEYRASRRGEKVKVKSNRIKTDAEPATV